MKTLKTPATLYHRYPGNTEPQSVLLYLNLRDRTAYIDWTAHTNAVSVDEYHNRILTWLLPSNLAPNVADTLLTDLQSHLKTILDNSTVEPDHQGNLVGELNDIAKCVYNQIEQYLFDLSSDDLLDIQTPEDWLYDSTNDLLASLKTQTVESLADELYSEASFQNVHIDGDLEHYLTSLLESNQ